MRHLIALFGLMLLAALPARAESEWVCDNAPDNATHVACADRELKKSDAELNRVYQNLMRTLSADSKPINGYGTDPATALRESQQAWVAFRDKNCHWKATAFYGGSGQLVIGVSCLAVATRARVKELQDFAQE